MIRVLRVFFLFLSLSLFLLCLTCCCPGQKKQEEEERSSFNAGKRSAGGGGRSANASDIIVTSFGFVSSCFFPPALGGRNNAEPCSVNTRSRPSNAGRIASSDKEEKAERRKKKRGNTREEAECERTVVEETFFLSPSQIGPILTIPCLLQTFFSASPPRKFLW